jgi:hypothetical protein
VAALGACTLVAVLITGRLLEPSFYSDDALVHQYWMWNWRDPQLFDDALTADLRESARYPVGYQALYWIASQLGSPIVFGEWLGVLLMAGSGWLIFSIVREHTSWRPAAWIAAGVFLVLIDIHRFYGGFPRGFVQPVVLLTVLLAMKRHYLSAALVASGGALFYPPASLLAVGVLIVSSVRWRDGRLRLDPRHTRFAVLAGALALVAVLGPQIFTGASPRVLTRAEAREFPEFSPDGVLPFFADSFADYLSKNRSGFDLRASGSILTVAALALLLLRPANLRLLRAEVLAMPVVSLAAYGVAQLVLFRLYLPHRYTYPLVAFFAIVIGVSLLPTWKAVWARRRPRLRAFALLCAPAAVVGLAVYAFPLGPTESLDSTTAVIAGGTVLVAATVAVLLKRAPGASIPALGAVLTGVALVGAIVLVPERNARGSRCEKGPAATFLSKTPKDAVIAGDPADLKCIVVTARRPVVISTQIAPAYEVDYLLKGRERMFAMLRAYYGPSADAIADLYERYGATYLWVRRDAVRNVMRTGGRWCCGKAPYGPFVKRLVRAGEPAVLDLPAACRRFQRGQEAVYDVRCIAREVPSTSPRASSA